MSILSGQAFVSPQFPMPMDIIGGTSQSTLVSGETVDFYVASTNALDAGSAAGTLIYARTSFSHIMDSARVRIGDYADTSFSFGTGTCLTTQKPLKVTGKYERMSASGATLLEKLTELATGLANGEFVIDHRAGLIVGLKATTAISDTATYVYRSSPSSGGGGGGAVTTVADNNSLAAFNVIPKKSSTSVNSKSRFVNVGRTGAAVAFSVKASAGNIFGLTVNTGTTTATSVRYIQLHDKASAPSAGEVPVWEFSLPTVAANNASSINFGEDFFGSDGMFFSTGIAIAVSATSGTYSTGVTTSSTTVMATYL